MHLDMSALHFPGNRWKQCIKAPRGNPGHPGIAEAWPGSGRAGGHLFCALNHLLHPPSLWWAWLLSLCACVEGCIYICVHYGCLAVSLQENLVSGWRLVFTGTGLVVAWQELSHWLAPFVHTNATESKHLSSVAQEDGKGKIRHSVRQHILNYICCEW